MSTLRISNIEAKSVPASATIDEKVKITNSSGDVLVFLDGKTSGITTVGINTTDANITFDANSNVLVTGIITATKFVGTIEPTNLTVGGDLTIPDKIIHTGDTNTAIRFPAADTFSVETAGSERLRVTSTGKVGIGSAVPKTDLDIGNTAGGTITLSTLDNSMTTDQTIGKINFYTTDPSGDGEQNSAIISAHAAQTLGAGGYLRFSTAAGGTGSEGADAVERLRITSTGQLLVGTTSASNRFKNGNGNGATPKFQFETANVDEQNDISLTFGRNNSFGAEIILAKHRAATVGGYTVVQSDDRLGGINFAGSDGAHFRPAALIQTRVDGTPGIGTMPGRLEFHTTADGAATPTERVIITSNGHTLFSGLTAHRDSTRNVNGITIKSTGGLSFQNYGSNGSRNWRMRPDDMSRWGDLDVSVSATANSATDWPGAAADKVITFGYDKTVTIPNGNLIMGSGYGIDFSATGNGSSSMSSELLDDYEEGSWTASVVGGNTITTNAAYYTKIGRMVYWHLHCKPTFAQNNTTVYNIYGLPYISANVTENYGWSGNITYTQTGNSATLANMRPLVQMNNTYIYFHTVGLGDATRIKNNFIRSTMLNQDFLLGGFYMAAY